MKGFRRAVELLYEDELDFAGFARRADKDLTRLSRVLRQRWFLPTGLGTEDLKQEMLLEAWKSTQDFLPGYGMSVGAFTVWRVITRAKRYMNSQRNSPRRSDSKGSRFAMSVSAIMPGDLDEEAFVATLAWHDPNQEQVAERAQNLDYAVARCRTEREIAILMALVEHGGCVELAVERLVGDEELRTHLGLGGRCMVRRSLWRTVHHLQHWHWREGTPSEEAS